MDMQTGNDETWLDPKRETEQDAGADAEKEDREQVCWKEKETEINDQFLSVHSYPFRRESWKHLILRKKTVYEF